MISKKVLFSSALAAMLMLNGCGKEEESDDAALTEMEQTFNASTATKIESSILDLPASLTGDQSTVQTQSKRIAKALQSDNQGSDNGMTGIYSGIPQYVNLAEMMKDMLKEIITNMAASQLLAQAELGVLIDIPDDGTDGPRKVKVEKPSGEAYEWKVSLYMEEASTNPEMIFRFTPEGDGIKGRLLFTMSEAHESFGTIEIERDIDVTFDGVSATKTMEIKVIQDLGNLRTYATQNWSGMTDAQKEALDIGQPDKVFLNVAYDGEEFTIYGTSYHPGWAAEATLNGETPFFGTERSMYMFKAKANDEGAKLYLALPAETTTDVSDVWDNDSLSSLFTGVMLNQINDYIDQESNTTQQDYMMQWVLGDALLSVPYAAHGDTYTQTELDAAAAYYATSNAGLSGHFTQTAADYNDWIAGQDDNNVTGYGFTKEQWYEVVVMAYDVKANIDTHGYQLSRDELTAFVNSADSGDASADGFKEQYKAISYMINPAYYSESEGFLGTYDGTHYYRYQNGTMAESTDTTFTGMIDTLDELDLSSIDPYVPAEVVSATITIE